jgi:hypothetical protein
MPSKWLILFMLWPTMVAAQTRVAPGSAATATRSTSQAGASIVPSVSSLIKVTIYPSRSEVVPNGSYGIYSDFENISSSPVLILPNQTALIVLPEASEPSACVDWEPGIFPTEPAGQRGKPWDSSILIQPGEHYLVFWDLEPDSQRGKYQKSAYNGNCKLPPPILGALGFVPGDYAFAVEGNAYVEPETPMQPPAANGNGPGAPASSVNAAGASPASAQDHIAALVALAKSGAIPAHHFSETKTLHVGISQITTLFAAMIGAFLAYWVVALRKDQDWDLMIKTIEDAQQTHKKWMAVLSLLRNAFLAALMGGVVTIVASRLSDTHFPLKVSVSDFWGALTIGFVSFFVGNKFISSLADFGTDPNKLTKPSQGPSTPKDATGGGSLTPSQSPASSEGVFVATAAASPAHWADTALSARDDLAPMG